MYHAHAYFNSVYRVLNLQPYNEINAGVYGFYGIILAPLMRLFGTDFKACVIALLILTFISILCYFYVLENLTDSAIVKILASICIITPFISLTSNIYLQLWPHRILFMGYILAFIVWKSKQNNNHKKVKIIGYVIMICSVIWNFETGIGCVLAYLGSEVVCILQMSSFKDLTAWKRVFVELIQIPLIAICSYGGALYNLAVSQTFLPIKVFLFPFIGNTYISDLNIPLSTFPSAWMQVMAVILISVGAVMLSTNLCENQHKDQKLIYLSACTIGVSVQMMYFINRSVYGNLYIVLSVISLILAFWIDHFRNTEIWTANTFGNGCFRALCPALISVMILISFMSVIRYYPLETAKESGRSGEYIENIKTLVMENVPKDTFGIGVGVPEIYSYLGWNTGFYGIDMSDFGTLPEEGKNYVYETINHADNIFVNNTNLTALMSDGVLEEFFSTHELAASFSYGEMEFGYYIKMN